jgi:hypothetical protein
MPIDHEIGLITVKAHAKLVGQAPGRTRVGTLQQPNGVLSVQSAARGEFFGDVPEPEALIIMCLQHANSSKRKK